MSRRNLLLINTRGYSVRLTSVHLYGTKYPFFPQSLTKYMKKVPTERVLRKGTTRGITIWSYCHPSQDPLFGKWLGENLKPECCKVYLPILWLSWNPLFYIVHRVSFCLYSFYKPNHWNRCLIVCLNPGD